MDKFNRDTGRGSRFGKRSSGRFQDDRPNRFSSRDSSRSDRIGPDRSERRYPERPFEKRMHVVTCAKCGERCEVPFRPREGKPVYCNECFRKNDDYKPSHSSPAKSEGSGLDRSELDQINKKLDKIMNALKIG